VKKYRFVYRENGVENSTDFDAKSPAHAKFHIDKKWPHVAKVLLVEYGSFRFINYETGDRNLE
jgi:hypothetical protein